MDYVPFLISLLYLYMYLLCDNKRYWIELNWIDCTAGLAGVSGAVPWSIRRCNNVHIDIKSISVPWLKEVDIDGKSGLLVPVKTEASGPPAGVVPAGVPWPADPSTPTAGWRLFLVRKLMHSNGWAEVVAGMHYPPSPRQCRWPGSCPADSVSAGQSLPGEPPPGTHQRCLVEEARRAPTWDPSTLSGWRSCRKLARHLAVVGKKVSGGFPWRRQRESEAPVSLFSGSWWQ